MRARQTPDNSIRQRSGRSCGKKVKKCVSEGKDIPEVGKGEKREDCGQQEPKERAQRSKGRKACTLLRNR